MDYGYILPCGWMNLPSSLLNDQGQHKQVHIVWFHFYVLLEKCLPNQEQTYNGLGLGLGLTTSRQEGFWG
jgi:hypothetical protein